jgi:DNA-binding transcriptional ArsR family regulator
MQHTDQRIIIDEITAESLALTFKALADPTRVRIIAALIEPASVLALTIALGGPWAFGWHLSWQMRRLDIDDSETCHKLFLSNRDAGLILALFLAIALVF